MDTILTWSGSTSHEIACFFRDWLTEVLPGIQPWISSADIATGKKWFPELMRQLSKTAVSITFVTPENVRSPWVYYEVGAVAAKLEECLICPYLVGVEPKHVRDTPLGQFQCKTADEVGTFGLIRSINERLGTGRSENLLKGSFGTHWPPLKQVLDQAREILPSIKTMSTTWNRPSRSNSQTERGVSSQIVRPTGLGEFWFPRIQRDIG